MSTLRLSFKKIFVILTICFRLNADVFIWDVGGVLGNYDASKLFDTCSYTERAHCYFSTLPILLRSQNPILALFNFKNYFKACYLNALTQLPYQSSTMYDIYSDDGITPLPPLLKDLMLGTIDYQEARAIWYNTKHPAIFNQVFEFNFNPERFATATTLLPAADLLRQCAQQKNPDGSRKHICIVCSNLDAAVVPFLKINFLTEVSGYVDHWIISGEVHCAKPDKQIYDLCNTYIKTLPEPLRKRIFFLDDQKVNRDAAHTYIPDVICILPEIADRTLKAWGILPHS